MHVQTFDFNFCKDENSLLCLMPLVGDWHKNLDGPGQVTWRRGAKKIADSISLLEILFHERGK